MIVRRRLSAANSPSFVVIAQHDHGQAAGQFAQRWQLGGSPGPAAAFAVSYHDVGWVGLDARVRWNADASAPFAFLDYPPEPKYVAYRAGIDLVATGSPYAGWLCSRHFARFASLLDDPWSAAFLVEETARQDRLGLQLSTAEQASGEFDFALLRACDALSLFLCLNEPGENTWPWYQEGIMFGGERIRLSWDGPEHLRLDPDPFTGPVEIVLPHRHLDDAGNVSAHDERHFIVGG